MQCHGNIRAHWVQERAYRHFGGANMNPSLRKAATFLVLAGAALLVSTGGKAYAQAHSFRSGSFGRLGCGSGAFHRGAVGPHWGAQQHGFRYGRGHVGNRWALGSGHGGFGYSPYYGAVHSWGPGFYTYPPLPYQVYGYPPDHRFRAYYVPRYRHPGRGHARSHFYRHH